MEFNFDYLLAAFWLTAIVILLLPMAIMERKENGHLQKIKNV